MSRLPFSFPRRAVSRAGLAAGLAAGATFLLTAAPARAQVVSFTAFDSGAGPGSATPNSNAAAAQFNAAVGLLGGPPLPINFESAPVGAFTSLLAAPGVTLTGTDYFGNSQRVLNAPDFPSAPALGGFNTTPGGAKYVDLQGGTLTFTFAAPVQAFGAYFTGIQPGFVLDTIGFNDGTSQSVSIPQGTSQGGGVSFAGFTDRGKSITSVTITASANGFYDAIGVDDVGYAPTPVPEASTTVSLGLLLTLGIGGLVIAARRKWVSSAP